MRKKKLIIISSIILFLFFGVSCVSKITGVKLIGIETKAIQEFSIGIYKIYYNSDYFTAVPPREIKNPVLTTKDITDRKAQFIADPFLIYENNIYYMFFEVFSENNGDIGMATSKNGTKWNYDRIILNEPFHLSYPLVFKWDSSYYMIPESGAANSIRLYKAVNFPYDWKLVKTLIIGKNFADSTILYYQNKWWIFTTVTVNLDQNLYLYFADNLEGPWFEHPKNPIIKGDKHRSRCGGNIINFGDRLIRIAQDDFMSYGNSLRAFEILKLTPEEYEENELKNSPLLVASNKGWNAYGMHQLSIHKINDKEGLACVDGRNFKKRSYLYLELPSFLSEFISQIIKIRKSIFKI